MKILKLFSILYLLSSCSNNGEESEILTKQKAIDYYYQVYGTYDQDYELNREFSETFVRLLNRMNSGHVPSSVALDEIDQLRMENISLHKATLKKLQEIKPLKAEVDILSKTIQNVKDQIRIKEQMSKMIEILDGGIEESEQKAFSDEISIIQDQLNKAERLNVYLESYRRAYKFTEEDINKIKTDFNLDEI